jgi:DNA polymerase-3 subunit beta
MTRTATKERPATPGEAPPGSEAGFAFTLPAGAFAAAVGKACAVVSGRVTIPILSHALLRLDAFGVLHVMGTNLDQVVEAAASTTHRHVVSGAITVPALDLKDALGHLKPAEDVSAVLDPNRALLVLKQGRTTYKLPTLPADDFPLVAEIAGKTAAFDVDAAALAGALRQVEMAASTEEARFYLNGVFFDFNAPAPAAGATSVLLVSTDAHRLHKAALALPDGAPAPDAGFSFILPSAAVRPLLAACDGPAAGHRLSLTLGGAKLRIDAPDAKGGPVVLTTKLIDGTFPDWRRVVPQDPPNRVAADRDELLAAVERVGIVQGAQMNSDNAKRRTAAIKLSFADGELLLSNRDPNTGEEADSACACSLLAGHPGEVGFNAAYLAAALRSFGAADSIEIAWTDAGGPALFTRHGAAGDADARVVMPMRF